MPLPPPLQTFADGPAEIALARALSYDRPTGLLLVAALEKQRQRSHLEALGEVSPDKDVKKAARNAAYKLKSAGVAGGIERGSGIDLTPKIETERIAAATAPGFDGRLWLVVPSLPGIGGGEIDMRGDGRGPRVEPVAELAIGRVRRFQAQLAADKVTQPPLLVDLDLAARLVAVAGDALTMSGKPVPPTMDNFVGWLARAIALGARPERASARAQLQPMAEGSLASPGLRSAARPLPEAAVEALATHPRLGFLAAPPAAFESIDQELRGLLHGQEAIEKDAFIARAKPLVDQAASAWWASPNGRKLAAMWLDATADVLLADGDAETAKFALAAADDVTTWEGAPLANPLVARAFNGAIDLDAAWSHREAHVRGEAHHGHE